MCRGVNEAPSYWEQPEKVDEFAGRAPDRRLLAVLESFERPGGVRVLDLGCAGGRNTVVLAQHGFDFYAVDCSAAMVERTRERVTAVIGRDEATKRVRYGQMDGLAEFESESFQLVVALGIYHSAASRQEWDRALDETARVLAPAGQLLVASFSPRSEPTGESLRLVAGESHIYEGFDSGPLFLLEAEDLDTELSRHGLLPVVPSETVVTPTDEGNRVTVNALYRKAG